MDGVCCTLLIVAMITASMSSGATPLRSIASRAASVARSRAETSAVARMRVMMPVRCWIHSSEESIGPAMSSFVTATEPRAAPTA